MLSNMTSLNIWNVWSDVINNVVYGEKSGLVLGCKCGTIFAALKKKIHQQAVGKRHIILPNLESSSSVNTLRFGKRPTFAMENVQ